MLEVLWLVVAFDDGGGRIVAVEEGVQMAQPRMSVRFRDENDIRAAEVFDWLPQQTGR